MIRYSFITMLAILLAYLQFPNEAFAQCIPGSPCVVDKTKNDPKKPNDGPNAAGAPNASKSERDSCDADFMNQIQARAFLEANREIMVGGGVITKPDSVLEYTCFEDRAKKTGNTAGTIFTGTQRWKNAKVPVPKPDPGPITIAVDMGLNKLNTSIQKLVLKSLGSYTGSFASNYLGGIPGAPGKGCGAMDSVYKFAKCENVNDALHIMSFKDIVGSDPRNIAPSAGTCSNNPITDEMIAVANNDDGKHSQKDDVVVHYDFVGAPTSCADPIPTGLIIKRQKFKVSPDGTVTPSLTETFNDRICSTPGCYFDNTTSTCKK